MLGAQLEAGPVEPPGHRQLGQQRGLDHPGVAGHHHQLTGVAGGQHVEGAGHPVDESGPALAPGGDGLPRVLIPVEGAEPVGELAPGRVRRPRRGGARTARTRSYSAPTADPALRASDRLGRQRPGPAARPSRWPGAARWRRGRRSRPAPRWPAGGPGGRLDLGAGPGRSTPRQPSGPPHTPDTLHTASPWRTSTRRVAVGGPGRHGADPAGGGRARRAEPGRRPRTARRTRRPPSVMPAPRRTARAGAGCGTRPPRRSGWRTRRRSSRPSPSRRGARG